MSKYDEKDVKNLLNKYIKTIHWIAKEHQSINDQKLLAKEEWLNWELQLKSIIEHETKKSVREFITTHQIEKFEKLFE
jgi:uncharacterized protein YqgQ